MNPESTNNGVGFGGLLFLVFLVLKLTGYINWSWWWVFAPFWGPVILAGVVFMVFLTIQLIKD